MSTETLPPPVDDGRRITPQEWAAHLSVARNALREQHDRARRTLLGETDVGDYNLLVPEIDWTSCFEHAEYIAEMRGMPTDSGTLATEACVFSEWLAHTRAQTLLLFGWEEGHIGLVAHPDGSLRFILLADGATDIIRTPKDYVRWRWRNYGVENIGSTVEAAVEALRAEQAALEDADDAAAEAEQEEEEPVDD